MTRIIFAGTPEFALASLEALVDAGRVPIAVLTQPDRPAGRGKQLRASPVKTYAAELGMRVLQPATLRDTDVFGELQALRPDIMIVAAYGLILPQAVLDIPARGCINVHASLLPRWRGAAPIQAAILAGDETTGISLMAMTAGLDTGPVFYSEALRISADETAGELHERLAELGGESLVANLDDILEGNKLPSEQDEALATYAPKIEKQDAMIDWSLPAGELARRVRAYNPFPGAYFYVGADFAAHAGLKALLQEPRIKLWRAAPVEGAAAPGTVLQSDPQGIVVACGTGALRLDELQLPGKRRAAPQAFVRQLDLAGCRLD